MEAGVGKSRWGGDSGRAAGVLADFGLVGEGGGCGGGRDGGRRGFIGIVGREWRGEARFKVRKESAL